MRNILLARWRSGLTHMPFTHAFRGSNPLRVTILSSTFAMSCGVKDTRTSMHRGGLAQLGEHLPYKQRVGGSIPSSSTIDESTYPFTIAGWSSWQLVGLITRRSQVQVLPPQPYHIWSRGEVGVHAGLSLRRSRVRVPSAPPLIYF